MTNDNKLFESIINSGKEQADSIIAEAEKKAAEIKSEAEKKAEAEAEEIKKSAQEKAINLKNSALSSASLTTRNAVLQAKRSEINKTLEGMVEYITALDDKSYFDFIYKTAENVDEKSGTVLLNKKDKERLPSDFTDKMKKAGIDANIGDEAVDIPGGFILRCGEIETNCSLDALIEDRKNELEDFINQSLFLSADLQCITQYFLATKGVL